MRTNLIILLFFFQISTAAQLSVPSPNNILTLKFELIDGKAYYSLSRNNSAIMENSRLGLKLNKISGFDEDLFLLKADTSSFDETWVQPWGEVKEIRNNYNELIVTLKQTSGFEGLINIIFRVYDYGAGFRYEIPTQPGLSSFEVTDELTEFNLTGNHSVWWIGAYQWNRYEYLYNNTPIDEIEVVHTPLTMKTSDGVYLSIHEAALTDYPSMTLRRKEEYGLKADLVPWSDGILVKTKAPMLSPWRTIQAAEDAGSLITDYLILNLNEPNKLGDVSWIKPAKYVGIWWEMHLGKSTWGSGSRHGATTTNAKRYIDFAAKYGFDGVLIEGWNTGWDGDWIANGDIFNFTTPYPDFDIKAVTEYASEKGVNIIGHHETGGGVLNYERQLDTALSYYKDLGINTIKTGYVNHGQNIKRIDEKGDTVKEWHHGQYMVRHYRKVVEKAAEKEIMINVHEPIKPTGIRRTYPNMMTREGARGQEFDAWDPEGGNPPEHTVILPFTRLLGGPMDFTPGIFNLTYNNEKPGNRVNTTLAKQLAHYVILYSPLHMAADLPENYEANPEPFKFIIDVPTDWEETKVLNGEIGEYITIVRKDRNSGDWYLGSATDETGRNFEVSLNFLESETKYIAEIYRDADDAHWDTNPYPLIIEKMEFDKESVLPIRLAPGGGMAVRFVKLNN